MVEIRGTKMRLLPAIFLSALIAGSSPARRRRVTAFVRSIPSASSTSAVTERWPGDCSRMGQGTSSGSPENGGLHRGRGTIYELVHGKRYKLIHSFCEHGDCSDGSSPNSLLIDVAGNLYGTTFQGGSSQTGTVFELSPNRGGDSWTYSQLYNFCSLDLCVDGANPTGLTYAGAANGVPYDGVSPLFGTADFSYGTANGGVAFQLSPAPGHPATWSQTVLYSFCAQANCADGRLPAGLLLMDASGNLFGTASFGGIGDAGTAFELSPAGGGWTETTLYKFCSSTNCADGKLPSGWPDRGRARRVVRYNAARRRGVRQHDGRNLRGSFQARAGGREFRRDRASRVLCEAGLSGRRLPGPGIDHGLVGEPLRCDGVRRRQ